MSKLIIYLDSGHHPKQPGKRSPVLQDGRQFYEWKANLEICREIIRLHYEGKSPTAANKDFEVHFPIHPTDPKAVTIERRAQHYNQLSASRPGGNKLILSVHSNAAGDGRRWHPAHGIETYYWHTSRIGAACATVFQNHLVRSFEWMDRGVKPTSTLGLLRMCNAPVILTETGFFTNEDQVQQMLKPEYITTAAAAHYAAIKELHEHAQDGKIF